MIELIRESFQFAQNEITRLGIQDPDYIGMASTLTVAVMDGSVCYVGHVGDSKCYLIRGGKIRQLTVDHNVPEGKNILSQAIGIRGPISIFSYEFPLMNNDILLLCSDGLTVHVSDQEMAAIVTAHIQNVTEICPLLIEAANIRGGSDNITVAIGRVSLEII
jgi:protein phosphatase